MQLERGSMPVVGAAPRDHIDDAAAPARQLRRTLFRSRHSNRDNEPGAANSTDPEAVIRQGGTTVINIGRNNFSPRYTNARTFQWAGSLSVALSATRRARLMSI